MKIILSSSLPVHVSFRCFYANNNNVTRFSHISVNKEKQSGKLIAFVLHSEHDYNEMRYRSIKNIYLH